MIATPCLEAHLSLDTGSRWRSQAVNATVLAVSVQIARRYAMRRREKYGRLSEADRLEIGDRIWSGQTHAEAAAAVGCSTKSIQRLLTRTGGLAPRGRNRSPRQLTVAEREEISRGLRAGDSFRVIARRLGRAPSTISREVAANGSRQRYRAWRGERRAAEKARRPKVAKLARCPDCGGKWNVCSPSAGLRSRLPIDFGSIIPRTLRCGCLTRRSISRCTCRHGGRCERNSRRTCARVVRDDDPQGTDPARGG